MVHQTPSAFPTVCEQWSRAVTGMLRCQWWLVDMPFQVGFSLLDALSGPANPKPADRLKELEQRAVERARLGLAPPREIYDVCNRTRIDWSIFPEWARPIDPEVFEGAGHEG
jgi:hypothetical protein